MINSDDKNKTKEDFEKAYESMNQLNKLIKNKNNEKSNPKTK